MPVVRIAVDGAVGEEVREALDLLRSALEESGTEYMWEYTPPAKTVAAPKPSPQVPPGQTWSVPATYPYPDPSKWTPMPDPLKPVQVWCGASATGQATAGPGTFTVNVTQPIEASAIRTNDRSRGYRM
ncbi:hypothetical protein 7S3_71 [uncultured Caudovirales phage]|uniref:Uncharacterized protein n=1 Tax=uncultured Caudovirales phage TaxID=2100421 RepID=A0A2H4J3Y4_9CAUD|nr:hypothetical protein 7S3_71 [uncultured Caudovirales phage]